MGQLEHDELGESGLGLWRGFEGVYDSGVVWAMCCCRGFLFSFFSMGKLYSIVQCIW